MINRKKSVVILASLILLALSSAAFAQNRMGPRAQMGGGQQGPNLLRMKDYLALTEQQVNDMKALVEKHRAAVAPLAAEMREKRQALKAVMETTAPDATTVGQIVIAQHTLRNQLRALNEKLRADMLAILTQEQKNKLLEGGFMRGPRRRAR